MYKLSAILFSIVLIGCNGKPKAGSADSSSVKNVDSIKVPDRASDSIKAGNSRRLSGSDTSDDTPSPAEERRRLSQKYNEVKIIDTTITNNSNDSLHLHLKYFCLKDDKIIVPKSYASDEKEPKDYIAYGFASDVIVVYNHDTVLSRQFRASSFSPFFQDNFGGNLKKYGSILMPDLLTSNKDSVLIVLHYPIAIPATDIGKGVFLAISKNGNYKILENY